MYKVIASDGFSFVCDELDDAVSMADLYHADSGLKAAVVETHTRKVVYETPNVHETGD